MKLSAAAFNLVSNVDADGWRRSGGWGGGGVVGRERKDGEACQKKLKPIVCCRASF